MQRKPPIQRGRKNGHKGQSPNRKPDKIVRKTPDKCSKCGSTNLEKTGNVTTTGIPAIPKAKVTAHITEECREMPYHYGYGT